MIQNDIKAGFPGAALIIIKDGKIVHQKPMATGKNMMAQQNSNRIKNEKDTLFDLASNTKMYATNYALQKLVYEKNLMSTKNTDHPSRFSG